jgi:hypothetical protein
VQAHLCLACDACWLWLCCVVCCCTLLSAGLPAFVQSEREARLAAAQSQVAYDAEVAALKLGKLQAYFDSTLCEHTVTVHPLAAAEATGDGGARRSRSVSTLPPPELPREVQVRRTELLGSPCLEGGPCSESPAWSSAVSLATQPQP